MELGWISVGTGTAMISSRSLKREIQNQRAAQLKPEKARIGKGFVWAGARNGLGFMRVGARKIRIAYVRARLCICARMRHACVCDGLRAPRRIWAGAVGCLSADLARAGRALSWGSYRLWCWGWCRDFHRDFHYGCWCWCGRNWCLLDWLCNKGIQC